MNLSTLMPVFVILCSAGASVIVFCLSDTRSRLRTGLYLGGEVLKLLLVFAMLWGVYVGQSYETRIPLLPGVDFLLRANALSMLFLTLSAGLWLLTTLYSIGYLRDAPHRSRFYGFFGLSVSATAGIALAGNLLTFFVFYEILTLATYPLVVHRDTPEAMAAGRKYLAYTLSGGVVLLAGVVGLQMLAGPVEFAAGGALPEGLDRTALVAIFALLIAGLGVKTALVPLHGWLPSAMVAPTPVSALLHGVAVVKAGAFGIVRVVYEVFGIQFAQDLGVLLPLSLVASFTIVYGSIKALGQDELKRLLAFSTVSQVSYIVLGVSLAGYLDTVGGLAHLVHQGIMKVTLFFCAGVISETLGIYHVSKMGGVARRMPWTMAAFCVGAFGMMGLPPLAGFISKWFLGTGAVETGQPWVLAVLVASTVLNAAYFFPVIYTAYLKPPPEEWHEKRPRSRFEADWLLLFPTLAVCLFVPLVGLFANSGASPLSWVRLISSREWQYALGPAASAVPAPSLDLLLFSWPAALALPLLLAAGNLARSRLAGLLAPLAALPALGLALFAGTGAVAELPGVLLGLKLGLDDTTRVFLVFTALLWTVAGLYAHSYLRDDANRHLFFVFYLLAMAGNLGLIAARDLAGFYLFYTLMSLSAYGLVVHDRSEKARHAGRVYLILAILGEAFVLPAVLLTAAATATNDLEGVASAVAASPHRDLIIPLVLLGFGVKAGALPLHVWLPLAHPAAPTPASAVLSGAMIKAGLLGWLIFLPLGETEAPRWGALCVAAGLVAAFYGVLVGLTQRNPKTVLAYSSISQMGLMTVAVGIALAVPGARPLAIAAIVVYAAHHALAKGALFLSVGVSDGARGLWGRGLVAAGLLLAALALAGAPLTSGAAAKEYLKAAVEPLPYPWPDTLKMLLQIGAVGTTLLMGRFLLQVWPQGTGGKLAAGLWLPWAALLVCVAALVFALPEGAAATLGLTLSFDAAWPAALGALIFGAGWLVAARRGAVRGPRIPEGDVIVPASRALGGLRSLWGARVAPPLRRLAGLVSPALGRLGRGAVLLAGTAALELRLAYWTVAGGLFLLLVVALGTLVILA